MAEAVMRLFFDEPEAGFLVYVAGGAAKLLSATKTSVRSGNQRATS
jgi:hypothetical protein